MNQKEVIKPIKKLALLPLTDGENGYYVGIIDEFATVEVVEWANYAAQEKVIEMRGLKAPAIIRNQMEKIWEPDADGNDPTKNLIDSGYMPGDSDEAIVFNWHYAQSYKKYNAAAALHTEDGRRIAASFEKMKEIAPQITTELIGLVNKRLGELKSPLEVSDLRTS